MNTPKHKVNARQQRHRYEQDSATDDGMPAAPDKPAHAPPSDQERLRITKQRITESRKRWGMAYPPD
ncbi:hypothetical protein Bsp3421_005234 [Burkholderia sp. FERM BP-3421]|jgi:hypothetical protein|uniref:hypothetical protein n=1 Tax=Burkholderia sp. FERM BP-3421 TaxID=1494466 RepID=UPI0023628E13|nr:hypothetical protein [Burkholderia sp. FERM BP-3421]WDD95075.1 hypothetical protein Bsp3421_005234 [Burkholderia sp. FERM BP-3421]